MYALPELSGLLAVVLRIHLKMKLDIKFKIENLSTKHLMIGFRKYGDMLCNIEKRNGYETPVRPK